MRRVPWIILPLFSFLFLLTPFFLLTACAPPATQTAPPTVILTPFATSTPAPSQTPEGLVTAGTPLPSPTPFTYIVRAGDTLSSIALKFGVSIDDLQAANPEIPANAIPVGQVLKIPGNPGNSSGEATPTAAAFSIRQVGCYPTTDRGMWCFALAHNDSSEFMENVSAQVTLVDSQDRPLASQTALLPLNILAPGASLPLAVFFPPEITADARPRVQVLTAIRLLPGDARYLPAAVNNTLVEIDAKGLSARLSGQVLLPAHSRAARLVWVAATAYDEAGRVTGIRRWESTAGLSPGGSLPFEFTVFSIGGRIARVEFAVEARP